MDDIKTKLKDIVISTMIPEVTDYLEDLHNLISEKKATKEDMETVRDLESFLVELENIVLAIDEKKINDEEAENVYQRVLSLIEESQNH